ncbi:MAG TPA: AmmeMemoRadiSam system protein A [Usitatibacter sp.]|nr:AmmeMemoRadiSam system protein A [Usitatibacter sp.]
MPDSAHPLAGTSRGPVLLGIAREAIVREEDFRFGPWQHEWLREVGASFVTLKLEGDLRGCIGTVDAHRILGDDVAHNARAAAYRDPRFPPVSHCERELLQIEVSVLSAREPIAVASEADAVSKLRPGIDGVYLEFQQARSTFLPQVWESVADPLEFLSELRRKAGLPARFWHPSMRLSRYTVEKFK